MNNLTNDQLQAFSKELLSDNSPLLVTGLSPALKEFLDNAPAPAVTSYDDWTLEQIQEKLKQEGITKHSEQ
jgi:hypothetical protein